MQGLPTPNTPKPQALHPKPQTFFNLLVLVANPPLRGERKSAPIPLRSATWAARYVPQMTDLQASGPFAGVGFPIFLKPDGLISGEHRTYLSNHDVYWVA